MSMAQSTCMNAVCANTWGTLGGEWVPPTQICMCAYSLRVNPHTSYPPIPLGYGMLGKGQ